jgi:hypothetical protein
MYFTILDTFNLFEFNMSQSQQEFVNEDDIRSIGGSEWALETRSVDTIDDGNAHGIEENSTNALLEVPKPFFEKIIIWKYPT